MMKYFWKFVVSIVLITFVGCQSQAANETTPTKISEMPSPTVGVPTVKLEVAETDVVVSNLEGTPILTNTEIPTEEIHFSSNPNQSPEAPTATLDPTSVVENPGIFIYAANFTYFHDFKTGLAKYAKMTKDLQEMAENHGCTVVTFQTLDTEAVDTCQVILILEGFYDGQIPEDEGDFGKEIWAVAWDSVWTEEAKTLGDYFLEIQKEGYGPFVLAWKTGWNYYQDNALLSDLQQLEDLGWQMGVNGYTHGYWNGTYSNYSSSSLNPLVGIPNSLMAFRNSEEYSPYMLPSGQGAYAEDVQQAFFSMEDRVSYVIGHQGITCVLQVSFEENGITLLATDAYLSHSSIVDQGGAIQGIKLFMDQVDKSLDSGPVNNCP